MDLQAIGKNLKKQMRMKGVRRNELAAKTGLDLQIRRVAVRDPSKPRSFEIPEDLFTTDPMSMIDDPTVDLVVEVMGGQDPAGDLVLHALERVDPEGGRVRADLEKRLSRLKRKRGTA